MTNSRPRWIKKLHYKMDTLFSRGAQAMMIWLGGISLFIILAFAIALTITGFSPAAEEPYPFIEAVWMSLLGAMGNGTIGDRNTMWGFRLLMLALTFGGIFFISAFIGLLNNSIQNRMAELRKGRSEVIEKDHFLILGWTQQIFPILSELVLANTSKPKAVIVILAEKDKLEMEDAIRTKIRHPGHIRIVCRTGNPMEMEDLSIVNLNRSRSIIVLSPDSETPDADVIKVALAITNHPDRRSEPYHITAGIRNRHNVEIARVVGKDEVEWISVGDMISRIIAQTSRQSGLSVVYTELLEFGRNEIYLHAEPTLAGKTFGAALNAYENCILLGLVSEPDKLQLNPNPETVIQPTDRLVVIANDDADIGLLRGRAPEIDDAAIRANGRALPGPENILILGWNWRGTMIVNELDHYAAPGSEVQVVADREGIEEALQRGCHDLRSLNVCYRHGDTTDRATLEELDLGRYDHVILLCYTDRFPAQRADAQTLITLLHLRDLAEKNHYHYSIVTEMLDVRNRKLASVTRADDFIVSDRLVSLMLSQVAENRVANEIFADIFNPEGAEIYLKPAGDYLETCRPVNFATMVEAANRCGDVALGYRIAAYARDANRHYGVVINPPKSSEVTLSDKDCLIVLAKS